MEQSDHMFDLAVSDADEAFAHLAAGIDALNQEDRSGWSGPARSARVLELGRALERLHAELVRAVGQWSAAGDYAADGSLSAAAWLGHRVPLTRHAAGRLVATARLAHREDRVGKALASGDITVSHVETMARAIRRREDIFATHGDSLFDAAHAVPPEEFRTAARRWRELADDEVGSIDPPDDPSRDELVLNPTLGGLNLSGWFHTEAGVEILNRIDGSDLPDPVHGERAPRSLAQRRAAKLYAMICGETQAPKAIDVTIDWQTMDHQWPTDVTKARCDVDGYGPVPPALIRSWLTESVLRRVMQSGSEVLNLGRAARIASPAQRRALRHRDGGCVIPDCVRPPRWTDAHHVIAHVSGGNTDLEDLALVCRRHHRMLDHGWQLGRAEDGSWRFDSPADSHDSRGPPDFGHR